MGTKIMPRVLVIGSGGREHALCRKLSEDCEVYCYPGNAGIENEFRVPKDLDDSNFSTFSKFMTNEQIDMAVIGPEKYLEQGIVDYLEKNGHKCFGTNAAASKLESSKQYAKEFMNRHKIPTAKSLLFEDKQSLIDYINDLEKDNDLSYPIVLKADSLAAGKGVVIVNNIDESLKALEFLFSISKRVIVEEFLTGMEASIMCFVDNNTIIPMPPARDYKTIFEDGKGPNTGGMGSYSPSNLPEKILNMFDKMVAKPFIDGINKDGIDFRGILFVGIMYDSNKLNVLEFNTRFGDPETEVTLPRLKTSLYRIFDSAIQNKLDNSMVKWNDEYVVLVVSASAGYPASSQKGVAIDLKDISENNLIHFGTSGCKNCYKTAGGRVLGAIATGSSLDKARENAYNINDRIDFSGRQFRKDIAKE